MIHFFSEIEIFFSFNGTVIIIIPRIVMAHPRRAPASIGMVLKNIFIVRASLLSRSRMG